MSWLKMKWIQETFKQLFTTAHLDFLFLASVAHMGAESAVRASLSSGR